jgi:uncharacterized protein (TIGR01319 family)
MPGAKIDPAKALIRDVFIDHIIKEKGLHNARALVNGEIIPTPKASLLAASLLADGTESETGFGSLMVVEIGGATINIHSVADVEPVSPQTLVRGLPEERIKRTVEGDLGIRWNARTIYEVCGQKKLFGALGDGAPDSADFRAYTDMLSENTGHVPENELERNMDIALCKCAAAAAVERHAGTLSKEFTVSGEVYLQRGKNLLGVQNVIGTGGIFKYGLGPERILESAFSGGSPWSLKPVSPRLYLDSGYVLYGIGLLSEHHPDKALRIAKKYIVSHK